MRYFLDTEFMEDGKSIELISIALVAQSGAEFYAENKDADLSKANEFVKANVIPHLSGPKRSLLQIRDDILRFTDSHIGNVEIWGYYADYDWVLFCQLFGRMVDLPREYPKYCRDLKQWADELGNPELPKQTKGLHHALHDSRWNKQVYHFLSKVKAGGTNDPTPPELGVVGLSDINHKSVEISNKAALIASRFALIGMQSGIESDVMILTDPRVDRTMFSVFPHEGKWDVYVFGQPPYPFTQMNIEYKTHFIMEADRLEKAYFSRIGAVSKLMDKAISEGSYT